MRISYQGVGIGCVPSYPLEIYREDISYTDYPMINLYHYGVGAVNTVCKIQFHAELSHCGAGATLTANLGYGSYNPTSGSGSEVDRFFVDKDFNFYGGVYFRNPTTGYYNNEYITSSAAGLLDLYAQTGIVCHANLGIGCTPAANYALQIQKPDGQYGLIALENFSTAIADYYPILYLVKSKNNTAGVYTVTTDGMILGEVDFVGVPSTGNKNVGAVIRGTQVGAVANGYVSAKLELMTVNASAITVGILRLSELGNVEIPGTNQKLLFGPSGMHAIYSNGTNLTIDGKAYGSGNINIINSYIGIDNTTPLFGIDMDVLNTYSGLAINTYSTSNAIQGIIKFNQSHQNSKGFTATVNGSLLGGLLWNGSSASAFTSAATIRVIQNGAASTLTPADLVFYTSNGTGLIDNFVIANNGRIGAASSIPTPDAAMDIRYASSDYWVAGTNNWHGVNPPTAACIISNITAGGYDCAFIGRQATSTGVIKTTFAINAVGAGAWTNGTVNTQISDLLFILRDNADVLQERMRIKSTGLFIDTVYPEYADNAAAVAASLAVGTRYRTGDIVKQVHA
jgi:hypothetical protein